MNAGQIERLLSSVPASVDERQRRRIDGYAATARRCEERIAALRVELERSLRNVDDAGTEAAADEALHLARELDSLERVQPRIDAWLRVAVGAVADAPSLEPFGEGPA